jgi:hypothetical protein
VRGRERLADSGPTQGLPGSRSPKALLVFEEVYGFILRTPANPPTKRPLMALMKQARAFGVGVVLATQNPMDLDYRALSNAGLWCIGRLQTDAERDRALDGLASSLGATEPSAAELGRTIQRFANRWFVIRNAHAAGGPVLLQPRYAYSWMRGPTRRALALAREVRVGGGEMDEGRFAAASRSRTEARGRRLGPQNQTVCARPASRSSTPA